MRFEKEKTSSFRVTLKYISCINSKEEVKIVVHIEQQIMKLFQVN